MSEQRYYREEIVLPVNHKYKAMTIAEIMAEAWISIEERLPGPFEVVLVSISSLNGYDEPAAYVTLGSTNDGKELYPLYDNRLLTNGEKITHWMPMPEAPKYERT